MKNKKSKFAIVVSTIFLIVSLFSVSVFAWFITNSIFAYSEMEVSDWSLPDIYVEALDSTNSIINTSITSSASLMISAENFQLPENMTSFIIPYNSNDTGVRKDSSFSVLNSSFMVNSDINSGVANVSFNNLMHGLNQETNYSFKLISAEVDPNKVSYTISYEDYDGNPITAPVNMPTNGIGVETTQIPLKTKTGIYLDKVIFSIDSTTDTPTPTAEPTATATANPTSEPTSEPTSTATATATANPTSSPTSEPTSETTSSPRPQPSPTSSPITTPSSTQEPTEPTTEPTLEPAINPTLEPTLEPISTFTPNPTPENNNKIRFEFDPETNMYLVLDENNTPLGYIDNPEHYENIETLVPLGIKKINPTTGNSNNSPYAIVILFLLPLFYYTFTKIKPVK